MFIYISIYIYGYLYNMHKLKNIFQTLSDSNRLKMIRSIADKKKSVGEIVKATSLSQPLVSHHLRVLKKNGVLSTNRKGPFIYYFIEDVRILYAINLFIEIFKDTEIKSEQELDFCPEWIIKKFDC